MKKSCLTLLFILTACFILPVYSADPVHSGNSEKKSGVVMMKTPLKDWEKILGLLKPSDVSDTRWNNLRTETWPHITVLYGLHDDRVDDVMKLLSGIEKPVSYRIVDVSVFQSKYCDILKFGIESEELTRLHQLLKQFPNSNTYSGYSPHMTIAYVRKGNGKNYSGKLKKPVELNGLEFVYSQSDGRKNVARIDPKDSRVNIEAPGFYDLLYDELGYRERLKDRDESEKSVLDLELAAETMTLFLVTLDELFLGI